MSRNIFDASGNLGTAIPVPGAIGNYTVIDNNDQFQLKVPALGTDVNRHYYLIAQWTPVGVLIQVIKDVQPGHYVPLRDDSTMLLRNERLAEAVGDNPVMIRPSRATIGIINETVNDEVAGHVDHIMFPQPLVWEFHEQADIRTFPSEDFVHSLDSIFTSNSASKTTPCKAYQGRMRKYHLVPASQVAFHEYVHVKGPIFDFKFRQGNSEVSPQGYSFTKEQEDEVRNILQHTHDSAPLTTFVMRFTFGPKEQTYNIHVWDQECVRFPVNHIMNTFSKTHAGLTPDQWNKIMEAAYYTGHPDANHVVKLKPEDIPGMKKWIEHNVKKDEKR